MLGDGRFGLFNVGSRLYDLLTAQGYWHDQIGRVLDFVDGRAPRVLDLGCGPGVSTFVLAQRLDREAQLVGIDFAHKMIERAHRNQRESFPDLSNTRFEHADARALPFDENSFDFAVGHSFLYLIPEQAEVLREVRRVLRPDGTLVLMEPNAEGTLWRAAAVASDHFPDAMRRPWEASRFATSMILWRVISSGVGQMSPTHLAQLFRDAGYHHVTTHSTLGRLGVHCVGKA